MSGVLITVSVEYAEYFRQECARWKVSASFCGTRRMTRKNYDDYKILAQQNSQNRLFLFLLLQKIICFIVDENLESLKLISVNCSWLI